MFIFVVFKKSNNIKCRLAHLQIPQIAEFLIEPRHIHPAFSRVLRILNLKLIRREPCQELAGMTGLGFDQRSPDLKNAVPLDRMDGGGKLA